MSIEALRERMAELSDLTALGPAGRLGPAHDDAARPAGPAAASSSPRSSGSRTSAPPADEVGEWLDELEAAGLDGLDAEIVRVARRDFDRARRVPGELAAEIERASSEGQTIWQAAREADDFAAFAPALRRNVELAREYAACFDDFARPYDALLADYDFGLTAARLQDGLRRALRGSSRRSSPRRRGDGPPAGAARRRAAARRARRAGADRRRRRRLADRRLRAPVQRRRRAAATAA